MIKKQVQLICKYCGETFSVRAYRAETAKYCSTPCYSADKSSVPDHIRHPLSEIDKAYIAGFVDGEGVITLTKAKRTSGKYNIRQFIIVTNSDQETIKWLEHVTGLGCVYGGTKPHKKNWSKIYRWQITSAQARALITDLLPYLRIKKSIAQVVMSLPLQKGKSQIDPNIYDKQIAILKRVRILNQRGAKIQQPPLNTDS